MPIFGDKNTFAISCKLPLETSFNGQVLIQCHFLVSGDFIGNEDEPDLLGTCLTDLERSWDQIKALQTAGSETAFAGLSDIEALELVRKANQLDDEFNPAFQHLPQQPGSFWYAHRLQLAESTDQVEVVIFNQKDKLKVIKQPYLKESRQIKSVLSDFDYVLKSFSNCLQFLKSTYPDRLS